MKDCHRAMAKGYFGFFRFQVGFSFLGLQPKRGYEIKINIIDAKLPIVLC